MIDRNKNIILTAAFLSALFLGFAASAVAATESFFVDSDFDKFNRKNVEAVFLYEGNKAKYYVEKPFWDTQNVFLRNQHLQNIKTLSNTFDTQIYHNLTRVFGLEWTPGIDGDPKLTVLFLRTKNNLGGFFRVQDEYPVAEIPNSNEREMVFLSFDFLNQEKQIAGFLAHEFQHVINFNQKMRLREVVEERWLNELLSEIAPTIAGLDAEYAGSNLQNRVENFLDKPTDPLMLWANESEDYSVVNIFAQYLYDNYGSQFFTLVSQSKKSGIKAINEAFTSLDRQERFTDVFTNWIITALLNNCAVNPINTYCYKNPNLSSDNLKIDFNADLGSGDEVISLDSSYPWQGQWFKYERNLEDLRPIDHIFVLEFSVLEDAQYILPYVVYPKTGLPQVFFANLQDGKVKFYIEDFGYKIREVVIMPINISLDINNPVAFSTRAYLAEIKPKNTTNIVLDDILAQNPSQALLNVSMFNGSLIRVAGDRKVYIIKGPYKRWIQSAEIMDMYEHLKWEDIIEVAPDVLDNYMISNVIRFAVDKKVYSVSSLGIKTWIQNEQEFLNLGYNFNMVYEVNEKEFNFYR